MKSRKWLTAAFSTLALGALGGAYTAVPAQAQTRPATSVASSTFKICSFKATGLQQVCIVSNGAGAQVNIADKNFAVFHKVYTSPDDGDWQLENAGGNCLRAYADGTVGLADGGCDTTVSAEFWNVQTDSSNDRTTYESEKYPGEYMGAFGDSAGDYVFIDTTQTGFFSGWFNNSLAVTR